MMDETNPETPEVEAALDDEALDTYETENDDQPELDEDGNPVEEPDDELVEVERNGKKYAVPKELKDELLMQADYTRKTQELAEQRKAIAAAQEQWQQQTESELKARARIESIDEAVAEFKKVDWEAWSRQNPTAANQAWMQYQQLKDEREGAVQTYQQMTQQRTLQEQREAFERLQKGQAELAEKIPGWGEDKKTAILNFGEKQLGFSRAELASIDDPRMVIALHYAMEGIGKQQANRVAKKAEAQQAIRPAASVKGGRTPSAGKLDDRMSTDQWIKQFNAKRAKA